CDLFVNARTHAADECKDVVLIVQGAQTRQHVSRAWFSEVNFYFAVVNTTTRVQLLEVRRDRLADRLAGFSQPGTRRKRHADVDTFRSQTWIAIKFESLDISD